MPATTVYQLPYPAPTDPADVPLDMQELAERIEAVVGPGTANGQVPVWDNTNKKWVPGSASADLGYVESTANTSVTATTEAAAQTIATLPALTMDGATKIELEVFAPQAGTTVAGGTLWNVLYDGGTSLGFLAVFLGPSAVQALSPLSGKRRLTPSAGSHTYSWRAFISTGNGSIICGAGGAGTRLPGYIKASRV